MTTQPTTRRPKRLKQNIVCVILIDIADYGANLPVKLPVPLSHSHGQIGAGYPYLRGSRVRP